MTGFVERLAEKYSAHCGWSSETESRKGEGWLCREVADAIRAALTEAARVARDVPTSEKWLRVFREEHDSVAAILADEIARQIERLRDG